MENPVITVGKDEFAIVNHHTRSLAIHINSDNSPLNNLICSFMEHDQELYAAVIAPSDNPESLARRVVSFLSAYMRINDTLSMERQVLICIENCLRKRSH